MAYPTKNKKVIKFVEETAALTCPDQIVWIDGSEAQLEALRKEACQTGEMIKLNQEKLPGCYYHRTAENDVAGAHLHLLQREGERRPHQLLDGSQRGV